MTHSPDLDKLAAALSAFQGALKPCPRNAEGEKERYADLAQIRNHTRRGLAKHGLSVVQSGGFDTIELTILHAESGQWLTLSAKCETKANGDTAYGARHAMMLALGIVEQSEFKSTHPFWNAILPPDNLTAEQIVERKRKLNAAMQEAYAKCKNEDSVS
jgi:hypothetical protein